MKISVSKAYTEQDYAAAIQSMLDAKAQERQYDSIMAAVGYRDDPNPKYAAEGKAFFTWRSAVWTYAESHLSGCKLSPSGFVAAIEAQCPLILP